MICRRAVSGSRRDSGVQAQYFDCLAYLLLRSFRICEELVKRGELHKEMEAPLKLSLLHHLRVGIARLDYFLCIAVSEHLYRELTQYIPACVERPSIQIAFEIPIAILVRSVN